MTQRVPCPVCTAEGRSVCWLCTPWGPNGLPLAFVVEFRLLTRRVSVHMHTVDLDQLNALLDAYHRMAVINPHDWSGEFRVCADGSVELLVEGMSGD